MLAWTCLRPLVTPPRPSAGERGGLLRCALQDSRNREVPLNGPRSPPKRDALCCKRSALSIAFVWLSWPDCKSVFATLVRPLGRLAGLIPAGILAPLVPLVRYCFDVLVPRGRIGPSTDASVALLELVEHVSCLINR